MNLRWADYVFELGEGALELVACAASTQAPSRTMYVLGVGFDPRCLVGLQAFLGLEHPTPPIVVRVDLPAPTASSHPVARTAAAANLVAFDELMTDTDHRVVKFPAVSEMANAGPPIAQEIIKSDFLASVGHLVLDISSLPSSLYFPLAAAALKAGGLPPEDPSHFSGEFQVVVCENPQVDACITELSVSHASYIAGFRPTRLESDPAGPTVWAPVVGEGAGPALRVVHDLLEPDEVCPILPFPARSPRRSDALLLEHQTELFDSFQVTPANIVFADERNPFDLYRTLCRLNRDYEAALNPLGPPSIELSSHSSKLLSLGVLLAAVEQEMPLATAVSGEYEIVHGMDLASFSTSNQLGCLWLAGDPYA